MSTEGENDDTAEVAVVPTATGGFTLEAMLRVHLGGGITADVAEEITAGAHEVCPYSAATRGNIPVTLTTTVA